MGITNNLKIIWKNDLRQSIVEQDVLNLRSQLRLIRNPKNENFRNCAKNEMKVKK